jgi:hypothetical protein
MNADAPEQVPIPWPGFPPEGVATDRVIALTRAWLERAVIGLNLCPFARAVHVRGRIRWVLSPARDTDALLAVLCDELDRLAAGADRPPDASHPHAGPHDAQQEAPETTLIIHPWVLGEFEDYNDFLAVAEAAVEQLGHAGVLQVASFHPQYRFADAEPDDPAHATNRSPFPMLHLLREDSIDRAVAAFPEAEAIYEANIRTLRRLGHAGWAALQAQCLRDAAGEP